MTALELALAGFYKVGGADLLRADIDATIGPQPLPYDVADAGLIVWPNDDSEVVYDLNAEPTIVPRVVTGSSEMPAVSADRLLTRRRPMPWSGWVIAWEQVVGVGKAKDELPLSDA